MQRLKRFADMVRDRTDLVYQRHLGQIKTPYDNMQYLDDHFLPLLLSHSNQDQIQFHEPWKNAFSNDISA